MKHGIISLLLIGVMLLATSCASIPTDRYNTQKGAAIGAGIGALAGQAIGRDTEATLLGAGIGTVAGALFGNARDQEYSAARDAAASDRRVVYMDDQSSAVEAIPSSSSARQNTDCHKVTKRVWDKGNMVSESVEEICDGEKHSKDY